MTRDSVSRKGGFRDTVRTFATAILIAVAIRTFLYEPFNIPSGSMIPTLLVGDYLFVSKMSYGYSRYSLPFAPPLISDRILFEEPERGDVIVFRKPTDTDVDYIKRLIGLPGDTIRMQRGILYINGQMVPRRRVDGFAVRDSFGRQLEVPRFIQTLPNGVEHPVLEALGDRGLSDSTGVFRVPEGHYFMMGDNRDNSVDSRDSSIGMVPRANLIGRAERLFWSWDPAWSWWEIWNWPKAIRFGRLVRPVE